MSNGSKTDLLNRLVIAFLALMVVVAFLLLGRDMIRFVEKKQRDQSNNAYSQQGRQTVLKVMGSEDLSTDKLVPNSVSNTSETTTATNIKPSNIDNKDLSVVKGSVINIEPLTVSNVAFDNPSKETQQAKVDEIVAEAVDVVNQTIVDESLQNNIKVIAENVEQTNAVEVSVKDFPKKEVSSLDQGLQWLLAQPRQHYSLQLASFSSIQ